jgi:hypothetical protein
VKTKKKQKENQEKEDSHQKSLDQIAPNENSDNNTLNDLIGSLSSELNDQEISWVKSLTKKIYVQDMVKEKKIKKSR